MERTNEAWVIDGIVYDTEEEAREAGKLGDRVYHAWRDENGWDDEIITL